MAAWPSKRPNVKGCCMMTSTTKPTPTVPYRVPMKQCGSCGFELSLSEYEQLYETGMAINEPVSGLVPSRVFPGDDGFSSDPGAPLSVHAPVCHSCDSEMVLRHSDHDSRRCELCVAFYGRITDAARTWLSANRAPAALAGV